jgi:phosphate transport system substrate-binding protein
MGRNKLLSLLLILTILFGCKPRKSEKAPDVIQEPSKSNLSGNISISGAYALYPTVQKWAYDFMKIHPGVRIEVAKTGTGQGITDLIDKKIQLAMISRPLSADEKNAGIWIIPVARDGVAPIINKNNPYLGKLMRQGLSTDELQKLFTSDTPLKWGEILDTTGNEKADVYTRADESGAADMFAEFLYRKASDLKGKKVTGDYDMIRSIQQNPLAIGFCNFSFAFDAVTGEKTENIQIIPFDLDFDNKIDRQEIPFKNIEVAHRSIWLGIYPESLCRELTIGSLGKPTDPAIIEFLWYAVSDGQISVKEMGLCELNNVYIRYSQESLK